MRSISCSIFFRWASSSLMCARYWRSSTVCSGETASSTVACISSIGGLAASVHKRRDIEGLTGMAKDVLGNGLCRLSKDITEDIVKLEIGDGQAVLGAVLLSGEHAGELGVVAH